jgi:PAS domain-containing protein
MVEQVEQRHLVFILARSFASRLATPVWLVDADGTVIYFNEAAEAVLGRQFIEGRGMPASEWSTMFSPIDESGNPVPYERLPLGIAISEGRPNHQDLEIEGADGVDRRIGVTAFPLFAHADECLGALAIFWERPESS